MLDKVKMEIKDLLNQQCFGILSTHSSHGIHACLVAFAGSADLTTILFATSKSTRKYTNIANKSMIAFSIDNRINDPSKISTITSVTAYGKGKSLKQDANNILIEQYLQKHPQLESFCRSPSSVFVSLHVDTYDIVSHFQRVYHLNINKD